ncbi:MAG: transposase [Solirubrobacterales bacterium]
MAIAAGASPYGLDLHDDSHAGGDTLSPGRFTRYRRLTENPVLRRPVEFGQYTSFAFQQELDDHKVLQSIGSVGDALDNAMAESFVDTVKTELIGDRVWQTRTQLELATLEWVDWYNHERLHSGAGNAPPAEYESLHLKKIERQQTQ